MNTKLPSQPHEPGRYHKQKNAETARPARKSFTRPAKPGEPPRAPQRAASHPHPGGASRPRRGVHHAGKPLSETALGRPEKFGPSFKQPANRAAQNVPTQAASGEPVVRFIPLGGFSEIGRNCSLFEYGNEIVVIDAGIQFPEEETPGIDYIIPNVSYIEQRKQNVAGIILTHGHYDHIHALPYLIEKLGNPIIYTAHLTKALVEKRFQEFPNLPTPRFQVVKNGDVFQISPHFSAEFFDIGHTIPDAIGAILTTPVGKMVHFGDFRLDMDAEGNPVHLDIFERIGTMGVHSIYMDSTNAMKEGFSLSERTVEENLEKLISGARGRVIVGIFSSLLTRIAEIMKICHKLGRKVAINGRSMKENVQIAQTLGYIQAPQDLVINVEDTHKYKDEKLVILTTGAQGETSGGLMKIVNREHRVLSFKKTDTIIFSSSVIPGNERSVEALQDNISRQVDEIYNSSLLDIHTSGHGLSGDLKLVMQLTKPKFVVPVHAQYFRRKRVATLASEVGISRDRVFLADNGVVANLTPNGIEATEERVPAFYVMVDGLGIGDVEEVVLRDRRSLAQEGMIVIILAVGRENGRLLKNPDIISRGFIYLKENQEVLEEIRKRIRGIISRLPEKQGAEVEYMKTLIRDQVGQFVYNKTKRRPMILPVIIDI